MVYKIDADIRNKGIYEEKLFVLSPDYISEETI
jgi:hypothetical protein